MADSLSAAIRAAVPAMVKRSAAWWEKVPAETLAELLEVRADWQSGALPGSKSAVARAIVDQLTARGLSDIGIQGVTVWLSKKG